MDQITDSYTSSSYQRRYPHKTIKSSQPSYLNSLHSVRQSNQKPTTKHFIAPLPPTPAKIYNIDSSNFKEAVRVLTSTPEFRYPSARRLKDIAPPPLVLSTIPKPSLFPKPPAPTLDAGGIISPLSTIIISPDFCNQLNETLQTTRFASTLHELECYGGLSPLGFGLSSKPVAYDHHQSSGAVMSPLGFSLSPTSLSWCCSVLLSPETLS